MWSTNILVSDLTLRNSPFWTVHPYVCRNVTIRNVTISNPAIVPYVLSSSTRVFTLC
jgi:polygalacturonase